MQLKSQKTGLWTQTPPAIFPSILGLFALGLGWRQAVFVYSVPPAFGEAILGAVTLLFLFAAFAYFAKFVRRPGVLADDLRIMPGRAGLSAASMAAMLLAVTLTSYSSFLAAGVLLAALSAHALICFLVISILSRADIAARRMTPVWQLTFVGFIVAPLAAIRLGALAISEVIFIVTLALAITIWAGHAVMLLRAPVPAPLRPLLAIHLAPMCLFGITSVMLGHFELGAMFGWLSLIGAGYLIMRIGYLTASGFSPLWGSFTFPMAAFSNLMLLLSAAGQPFRYIAGFALIASTIIIPMIAYKTLKMWAAGNLAAKTNAAKI